VEINFENDELILYCGHHVAAPQLMPKTTITQYLDNIVRNAQEITQSRDATDDIADAAAAIIADIKDLRANYNLEPLRKGG
jgi:hypothetical protein